jgi:hypothetical protein
LWASQLCRFVVQSLSFWNACVSITREATADGRLQCALDGLPPKLQRRTWGLLLRSTISRHSGSQTFKNACRWKKRGSRDRPRLCFEGKKELW